MKNHKKTITELLTAAVLMAPEQHALGGGHSSQF